MSDSDKSYRKVDNFYKESKSTPSFGKSVVVPFVSGVLGAILVVGTCFGVPQIKSRPLDTLQKGWFPVPLCKGTFAPLVGSHRRNR